MLLWHFILFDFLTWVTVNYFPHVTALPELTGTETLVTVLLSLLGLGAMRTAEKFEAEQRERGLLPNGLGPELSR